MRRLAFNGLISLLFVGCAGRAATSPTTTVARLDAALDGPRCAPSARTATTDEPWPPSFASRALSLAEAGRVVRSPNLRFEVSSAPVVTADGAVVRAVLRNEGDTPAELVVYDGAEPFDVRIVDPAGTLIGARVEERPRLAPRLWVVPPRTSLPFRADLCWVDATPNRSATAMLSWAFAEFGRDATTGAVEVALPPVRHVTAPQQTRTPRFEALPGDAVFGDGVVDPALREAACQTGALGVYDVGPVSSSIVAEPPARSFDPGVEVVARGLHVTPDRAVTRVEVTNTTTEPRAFYLFSGGAPPGPELRATILEGGRERPPPHADPRFPEVYPAPRQVILGPGARRVFAAVTCLELSPPDARIRVRWTLHSWDAPPSGDL